MKWADLVIELDLWAERMLTAELWWRDDDAHKVDPQLSRLLNLAAKHEIQVALAVVPQWLQDEFVNLCRELPFVRICQHGFAHVNHGKGTGRAGELESHRSKETVFADLVAGRQIIKKEFPDSLDVLVPPWNKIAEEFIDSLPDIGIKGLSTFYTPTESRIKTTVYNCHVDIIKWKKPPHFRGEEKCLTELVRHLIDKRTGKIDLTEPTGILSHHLDHDEACFEFLDRLFEVTKQHSACRWLDPKDLFK